MPDMEYNENCVFSKSFVCIKSIQLGGVSCEDRWEGKSSNGTYTVSQPDWPIVSCWHSQSHRDDKMGQNLHVLRDFTLNGELGIENQYLQNETQKFHVKKMLTDFSSEQKWNLNLQEDQHYNISYTWTINIKCTNGESKAQIINLNVLLWSLSIFFVSALKKNPIVWKFSLFIFDKRSVYYDLLLGLSSVIEENHTEILPLILST